MSKYIVKYEFENDDGELKHDPQILLLAEEKGEIDSDDICQLFYCSIYYASKKLRRMYMFGFLSRKRKKPAKHRGRPGFVYELTKRGGIVCDSLHKKGY